MNTKHKGDIAETRFIYEFVKRGYSVLVPFGDNSRYDMVIEMIDGTFKRVQVKYTTSDKGEKVIVPSQSKNVKFDGGGKATNIRRQYTEDEIDYIGVYVPDIDKCFLIPIEKFSAGGSTVFRLKELNGFNQHEIKYLTDYELDKILGQ